VEDQRSDPASTLHFTRDLIALRRSLPDLRAGAYVEIQVPRGAWAWRRGERVVVAVTLGSKPREITGVEGAVALATDRTRDGELLTGRLRLGPAEGVVVVSD
jgi:glycosidase